MTPDEILPYDGSVLHFGKVFTPTTALELYQKLLHDIKWEHDVVKLFGKTIVTKRKIAWYAKVKKTYTYTGVTKSSLAWTPFLEELMQKVSHHTSETYNSCLLNLYHNGAEGMAWHSDGEKELVTNGSIASLSLGASRKFSFKHKQTKHKIDIDLHSGDLIEMRGLTQKHWLHRLPPTTKCHTPRINLTFRQMN